ncbi:YhjD/YihY/BrkB family envelope integrity protein [Thiocapsa rosea]|uniref:Membrane protein n=1 Tax=Thiocapsa rosea TaxID=69360 RepID=A0A495V3X7_9GAMM|nr:YhjD/YihY/BrkB family envelope integrity protein [Thiocapsa rosea]RKT43265.1 membrane protein [Thiocapsa rosea]
MNHAMPVSERLDALLWSRRLDEMPPWKALPIWFGRLIYALTRDLTQGYLSLQAMSLVYTTILALVPLLAVTFSVLKGFGVHNQLEPLLLNVLAPLGEGGVEITIQIIGFVDNMRVGVLGSVGLALLIYTVISLVQKIEQVFNFTWRVSTQRSFAQRFSKYLSVILVGPVLFFSAVGLSASLGGNAFVQAIIEAKPFGHVWHTLGQLGPYMMISLTFAFFYVFVPNTRVHIISAVVGALIAGLLWEFIGGMFSYVMASSTRLMAVYSSLAILILFMIWIYIAWLILLIGASIAFYHQHPEYLRIRSRDLQLSNRQRERLALILAGQVALRYESGGRPWSSDELARTLEVPKTNAERMLGVLEESGFLIRTAGDSPTFVPARATDSISVKAILDAVRCFEERESGCRGTLPDGEIARIETELDRAIDAALAGMTWRDLAHALDTSASAGPFVESGQG